MVCVMGHVKKSGQLSLSDINKSCVLIITRIPASYEKKRLLCLYTLGGGHSASKSRRVTGYHSVSKNLSESLAQYGFSCYDLVWSYLPSAYVQIFCRSCNTRLAMILHEPGHEKMCLMSYANNKGADQPAHPRSLIRAVWSAPLFFAA